MFARKNAWNQMTSSIKATWNNEEVPEVHAEIEIFQHKVEFLEILTEAVPQVCLQWLFFAEFGVNDISSPISVAVQVLSFVSSTLNICLALSKVSKKYSNYFYQKTLICESGIFLETSLH